jgi:hypothetical protein
MWIGFIKMGLEEIGWVCGTSGRSLLTWRWVFGFHKCRELLEQLKDLASPWSLKLGNSVIRHMPSYMLFSYRDCPISIAWSGVAQCCVLTYCSQWSAVCNPWAIRCSFLALSSSPFSHIRATKCSGRKSFSRLYGYFLITFCVAMHIFVLCEVLVQLKIYIVTFNFPL